MGSRIEARFFYSLRRIGAPARLIRQKEIEQQLRIVGTEIPAPLLFEPSDGDDRMNNPTSPPAFWSEWNDLVDPEDRTYLTLTIFTLQDLAFLTDGHGDYDAKQLRVRLLAWLRAVRDHTLATCGSLYWYDSISGELSTMGLIFGRPADVDVLLDDPTLDHVSEEEARLSLPADDTPDPSASDWIQRLRKKSNGKVQIEPKRSLVEILLPWPF